MTRKRLGEVLIDKGLIDDEDLEQALNYQEKSGYRLGTALVALRIIAEWQLTEALGAALDVEVINLNETIPEPEALKCLPVDLAERYDLLPIRIEPQVERGQVLVVAMTDPLNRSTIQRIEHAAGHSVQAALASLSAIQRSIRIHYHGAKPGKVLSEASRLKPLERESSSTGVMLEAATLEQLSREAKELSEGRWPDWSSAAHNRTLAVGLRLQALLQALEDKGLLDRKEYATSLESLLAKRKPPR